MNIIEEENSLLRERLDLLIQENEKLKKHISSLQELLSTDICKFFKISNSIKQTRKRFCYKNVRECYGDLVYFYGCTDPVQEADDYKECYKDIFGKEYTDDDTGYNVINNIDDNTIDEDDKIIETIFKDLIGNIEINTDLHVD